MSLERPNKAQRKLLHSRGFSEAKYKLYNEINFQKASQRHLSDAIYVCQKLISERERETGAQHNEHTFLSAFFRTIRGELLLEFLRELAIEWRLNKFARVHYLAHFYFSSIHTPTSTRL